MRAKRLAALLAPLLWAGCSSVRWSGHHVQEDMGPGKGVRAESGLSPAPPLGRADGGDKPLEVRVSTAAARAHPAAAIREPGPEEDTLYYSDLGPDAIDVSAYPTQQRHNYRVFASACAQCHALARTINAPTVSRAFWEFYLYAMRTRSSYRRGTVRPVSSEDSAAILDFLDYDSRERKVKRADDFEELTRELKKRFDAVLERRLRRLERRVQP